MNALPNLQDLAHEGRPSSESRLRPVLGQGGVEHDAGAFVRSAQGGTGGDCGGAEGVAAEASVKERKNKAVKVRLTCEMARALFFYDPLTGFVYRKSESLEEMARAGRVGSFDRDGYLAIRVFGYGYRLHRVIWLMVHGEWPAGVIDHINRNPSDNRIKNLRDVDLCASNQNRVLNTNKTTGVMGVCRPSAAPHRFKASIRLGGKNVHLGYFDTVEEARSVYLEAKKQHVEGSPR